jgi:hypothetical protein
MLLRLGALLLLPTAQSQYLLGSNKDNLVYGEEATALQLEVETTADVEAVLHPELLLIDIDIYRFDFPLTEDYRIGLLMDPCRNLSSTCCDNVYGEATYEALVSKDGMQLQEATRVVKTLVLASEQVSPNYLLVYEDGSSVPEAARRAADDDGYVDTTCTGDSEPFNYCTAKNNALRPSPLTPPCTDNNSSLNTLESCPSGTACVQVGYSQNAFIVVCQGDQSRCGTYIEVHQQNGSPYQLEAAVIAEVLVDKFNVSGYSSTQLPLAWMGNSSRVLCAYTESFLRVGSMIFVLPSAPVCCCPPSYSSSSRLGAYMCPYGPYDSGAYATQITTVAEALIVDNKLSKYPFCHSWLDAGDRVMCSVNDATNGWQFSRNCSELAPVANSTLVGSRDLNGEYAIQCPYFNSCALSGSTTGSCSGEDSAFSFSGRVGRVVALFTAAVPPTVSVTFNDGRTTYDLLVSDVQLEYTKSMYEMWWVQRTPSERVVQKRKGFNVTWPPCTFDPLFERYFPYAEIDLNGQPIP